MENICILEKCTGCHACYNICPREAITMQEDKLGFLYPTINNDLCIDCNLCKKVCPVNNEKKLLRPIRTYAAVSKDYSILLNTASGGVASTIGKLILEEKGVYIGCCGTDYKNVHHICIEQVKDLNKLMNSKYVQSRVGSIFLLCKSYLEQKKLVLFSGTPCQIAGLKSFLKKDYSNLITIDLVCHGVPSQKLLNDAMSIYKDGIQGTLFFRSKEKGISFGIYSNNIKKDYPQDLYIRGFINGLFFRKSCYICDYSKYKRCSDITLADFWGLGLKKETKLDCSKGVSLILVNTNKGNDLLEKYKSHFFIEERSLDEAILGNEQLQKPFKIHPNRNIFEKNYINMGFEKACIKYSKRDLIKDRLIKIKNKTKQIKIVYKIYNIIVGRK